VQQDANWNVTALVSTSGSVVERYVYDTYGKPTFLNASWGTLTGSAYAMRYLFQGSRYDTTSGLYDGRGRPGSPTLGRWVQLDPVRYKAGDVNLYRALADNPSNHLDPTGTFNWDAAWTGGAGGAAGGAIVGAAAGAPTGPGMALGAGIGAGIGWVGGFLYAGFATPDSVKPFSNPRDFGDVLATGVRAGFLTASGVYAVYYAAPTVASWGSAAWTWLGSGSGAAVTVGEQLQALSDCP
jgi:RHS repeat-associated protein